MRFHMEIHGVTETIALQMGNTGHAINLYKHLEKQGFDKDEFILTAITTQQEIDLSEQGPYVRVYLKESSATCASYRDNIVEAVRKHPVIRNAAVQFIAMIEMRT